MAVQPSSEMMKILTSVSAEDLSAEDYLMYDMKSLIMFLDESF